MSILLRDNFDNDSGFWTKTPPESWSLEAGKYKVVVPDSPGSVAISSAGDVGQAYVFDDSNNINDWTPDFGTWQYMVKSLEGRGSGMDSLRNNATISNNYTNYNVSLKFQYVNGSIFESNNNYNIGFFTRYIDENNCLLVFLSRFPTPKIGFFEIKSAIPTFLKDTDIPNVNDRAWHTLDITDNGSKITVKLDGTTYLDKIAYTPGVAPGKKGIAVNNDLTYRIDDIIIKNLEWVNYIAEAKVRLVSGFGAGLMVKVNNDFTRAIVFIISQGIANINGLIVAKIVNNVPNFLSIFKLADLHAEYNLKIKAEETFEFYIKGGEYLEETLLPNIPVEQITESEFFDIGKVGFLAFQNSTAYFDDVKVTKLPLVYAIADFNGDGYINMQDFSLWRLKCGKKLGDVGWDPIYDLSNDKIINITDFPLWKTYYGKTVLYD